MSRRRLPVCAGGPEGSGSGTESREVATMGVHRGTAHPGGDGHGGHPPGRHRGSPLRTLDEPALGAGVVLPVRHLNETPVPAETAYQLVHDELLLDGNARLNLATFVTTWMEPQASRLMLECAEKNMIDKDEYPQTAELEQRCVSILAHLWNAPDPSTAIGCSTTGSSEGCMLGGLALKRRWAKRRAGGAGDGAAGSGAGGSRAGESRAGSGAGWSGAGPGRGSGRPNLVMGGNVQVCWEKFCRYWQVEPRLVPMEAGRLHLTGEPAAAYCDENTIGVVAVLGSTMDGSYEPVAEIAAALDELHSRTGIDVPVHVDGASGGMIAPFLDPELPWDFRLPRVASINTSGHKYGLVYPGVGWVLWRDHESLPEELVFNVNYLGGNMPTFALNFSRPGAEVVAQYYVFLRLGMEGFRRVQQSCRDVATWLAEKVAELGPFELITRGEQLPVFAFTTKDDVGSFNVFDVSRRLRERGWQVPAYTFPENRTDLSVLRVVVRNGFTHDLAELLLGDLRRVLPELERQASPLAGGEMAAGFRH
ncbi:MAG TPA: glutamate decarboxylase [Acidimicrobiales bacterium]|nr:glutamate decarboxylase [Acidimicrobiales bacterium]